ncbi:MAG: Hsp20/alpha crystallin family protein [Planctomycetes bacterium]|nr:Hsp20/alpha crystallin family protein [Planctomycetota bacterium]
MDKIGVRAGSLSSPPAVDVIETEEEVRVLVDLPGVDPEQVTVELTGHMLTIAGERAGTEADDAKAVHVRERFQGSFRRSVPLPVPVKPDEVEAEVANGVLCVRMPKADVARSKRIPIKAAPKSTSSPAVGPEGI